MVCGNFMVYLDNFQYIFNKFHDHDISTIFLRFLNEFCSNIQLFLGIFHLLSYLSESIFSIR